MRRAMRTVIAALSLVALSVPCLAMAVPIGLGRPLGERGFEQHLRTNPELRTFVALRGYPDWVEEVEVDSALPLDAYELRLYYLRLDREVAFTDICARLNAQAVQHIGKIFVLYRKKPEDS